MASDGVPDSAAGKGSAEFWLTSPPVPLTISRVRCGRPSTRDSTGAAEYRSQHRLPPFQLSIFPFVRVSRTKARHTPSVHVSPVPMSSLSPSTLRSRVLDRLSPHGSEGVRTELAGVVDLEALEEGRYGDVLESVNSRLSTAQYSLISMLVAGIYFGLLVGHWLFSLASWPLVVKWLLPVVLVTVYAVYSSYHTIVELRQLAEARALLHALDHREASPHP